MQTLSKPVSKTARKPQLHNCHQLTFKLILKLLVLYFPVNFYLTICSYTWKAKLKSTDARILQCSRILADEQYIAVV